MLTGKKLAVATGISLAVLTIGAARESFVALDPARTTSQEKQMATSGGKFFCNTNALNEEERAHHTQLTEKLISVRKDVVEIEKGYDFQYRPPDISIFELADWVVAEGKCCPFFDFHIDMEEQGTLLCLRL